MTSRSTTSHILSVRMPAELVDRIDTLAREETRTRSQQVLHLVRMALRERQPPADEPTAGRARDPSG